MGLEERRRIDDLCTQLHRYASHNMGDFVGYGRGVASQSGILGC